MDSAAAGCMASARHQELNGPNGSFRKLGGTLLWGPYNKDPGTMLGSPIFGNSQIQPGLNLNSALSRGPGEHAADWGAGGQNP